MKGSMEYSPAHRYCANCLKRVSSVYIRARKADSRATWMVVMINGRRQFWCRHCENFVSIALTQMERVRLTT